LSGAGLIIGAPKSGSGKTLITAGLLRCLRDRGFRVAAAKVGPDYIDPTFHTQACGLPCINLDPWAMRRQSLAHLVEGLEDAGDLVLCEGVMGLFDGVGPDGEAGSTAELARVTGWPVVLVVDAQGQGTSIAALIEGFARHDPTVPLAGVIFNRVASARHRMLIEAAIARHLPDLPVLGALASDETLHLAARHLGLVPSGEDVATEAVIERSVAWVGATIDIDRLRGMARPARRSAPIVAELLAPLGRRIAVARDAAFLAGSDRARRSYLSRRSPTSRRTPRPTPSTCPAATPNYMPQSLRTRHGFFAVCARLPRRAR
jgi:cobyrinic acid a,c-diamide synthase